MVSEKRFQDIINNSEKIKSNINSILGLNSTSVEYAKEVEFINGITSDFIVYDNQIKLILAILECKRADIGVTEYVRGVGQLLQYEYFQENNIPPKKYAHLGYSPEKKDNILIIPSDFVENKNYNIGNFKYPDSSKILEVHLKNEFVREITKAEIETLSKIGKSNCVAISQYYFRDNRLFEYYILLKFLLTKEMLTNEPVINRMEVDNLLRGQIKVINNGNWRNAFITLSSLGFIDNSNKPTEQTLKLIKMSFEEFVNSIYEDYIKIYVDTIMGVLEDLSVAGKVEISNVQLSDFIRKKFQGKDVLYLTESNNRYISSWLNIMRDDIGCINFESKKRKREIKINFIPDKLSKNERINKIKLNGVGLSYVNDYNSMKQTLVMTEEKN